MKKYVVLTSIALGLIVPGNAIANARVDRFVDRLAAHAASAPVDQNCVVLRVNELCGYRARLVARSNTLGANVLMHAHSTSGYGIYTYELVGRTRGVSFFCTGSLYAGPNHVRADQSITCYGSDDPTWHQDENGVIIRMPRRRS